MPPWKAKLIAGSRYLQRLLVSSCSSWPEPCDILIVGSSVAEGWNADGQHGWAQQLAAELCLDGGLEACVFSPREGETLVKLLERHAAQAILVVGATGTARAACLTEHTARHTHTHTHTHSGLAQHARARAHCRCCG